MWPTHGAGSFCSAPPGARADQHHRRRAGHQPAAARARRGRVRRRAARLLGSPSRRTSSGWRGQPARPRRARRDARDAGGADAGRGRRLRRPPAPASSTSDRSPDFAAAHIPGALSIPLRPAFATWLGWLVPPDRAAGRRARTPTRTSTRSLWQAAKIGYDNIVGELAGGIGAWAAAGCRPPITALIEAEADRRRRGAGRPAGRRVRAPGTSPAPRTSSSATCRGRRPTADGPTVVMCGHGERAMGAASLLERAGHREVAVLDGGPEDWAAATGQPLETGPMTPHARRGRPAAGAARERRPVHACWSRSTPWSAACSARNAPSCRCWPPRCSASPPTPRADLHPRLRPRPRRPPTTWPAPGRTATAASRCWSPAGWSRVPVPLLLIWAPTWGWVVAANVLLGDQPGADLVHHRHHEDRPGRPDAPRPGDGAQRGRRLPRRRRHRAGHRLHRRQLRAAARTVPARASPTPPSASGLSTLAVRETRGHAELEAHHATRADGATTTCTAT